MRASRQARNLISGYIEEWSDARLVRDAHLGSIWEGTSNIVALDVLRAIRRDAALPALMQHLHGLLADTPLHPQVRAVFNTTLARVLARADAVASAPRGSADVSARQVGSALYHLSTAVAMAWEAGRTGSARRMRLAQTVLRLRLLPQDPLADDVEPDGLASLLQPDPSADAPEAIDQVQVL